MREGLTYIDVKPTITASSQHIGPFHQDDVLFDWTEVRIPAGVGRLVGLSANMRGVNGAAQSKEFDVYFSKSNTFSLGTLNSGVDLQPNNDLLGAASILSSHYMNGLNHMEVANMTTSNRVTVPSIEITGAPKTQGTHRIYIAGVAQAAGIDFSTNALTDAAVDVSGLSVPTFTTLDGTSLLSVFGPGDIIHAYNPVAAASVICGEVTTLDANNITFRADGAIQYSNGGLPLYTAPRNFTFWQVQNGVGGAGDLEDTAELYNVHPITLKLSFAYES